MSAEPASPVETAAPTLAVDPAAAPLAQAAKPSRTTLVLIALCAVSLLASVSLWFKLSAIQEALARQSADATAAAVEGRTLAKSAQDTVREMATRQALLETRLQEVALQRGQLEELIQSLSRSRDDNLLVDVDSALRLAQQQANLTGSLEPLLAALRSAEQRVQRAAQPRLSPLLRALAKDIERVKSANVADTPSLLIKLDELVRLVDDLPLANSVATLATSPKSGSPTLATRPLKPSSATQADNAPGSGLTGEWPNWLRQLANAVRDEARSLVRVSRVDTPEAALLSPEQSFFARENMKLKLLNARLALLSRQFDITRNDLAGASQLAARYFDANARTMQQANALLAQLQSQLKTAAQPRIDDTLSALATLSANPGK
ncbi:MAG: uroporphyrinogen-III C-methyltransferase [Brachymonas sp.]